MRTLRALGGCGLFALALFCAEPARAGGCQAEAEKLCKDEKPVFACLKEHKSELSAECAAYLSLFERIPSCVSDAVKLCPSDKPSGAGVIACLRGRQSDLSDDCRKEIGNLR